MRCTPVKGPTPLESVKKYLIKRIAAAEGGGALVLSGFTTDVVPVVSQISASISGGSSILRSLRKATSRGPPAPLLHRGPETSVAPPSSCAYHNVI
jgi:hypothetical protein